MNLTLTPAPTDGLSFAAAVADDLNQLQEMDAEFRELRAQADTYRVQTIRARLLAARAAHDKEPTMENFAELVDATDRLSTDRATIERHRILRNAAVQAAVRFYQASIVPALRRIYERAKSILEAEALQQVERENGEWERAMEVMRGWTRHYGMGAVKFHSLSGLLISQANRFQALAASLHDVSNYGYELPENIINLKLGPLGLKIEVPRKE